VIAYCGVPLTDADGNTLGSFCAIEHGPREWTAIEIEIVAGKPSAGASPRIPIVRGCFRVSQTLIVAHKRLERSALWTALLIWFGVGSEVDPSAGVATTARTTTSNAPVKTRIDTTSTFWHPGVPERHHVALRTICRCDRDEPLAAS